MPDRRTLLRGLAALPLTTVSAAMAPASAVDVDPIIQVHREWKAARVNFATTDVNEAEAEDALYAHVTAAEQRAIAARPCTVAGAIVALEWASAEMREWHDTGVEGDELILALIDGALHVLRRQVA